MGSPPLRDTTLEAPSFTPSHPSVGRMLNFTEFLLGNVEDWSKPHPFCPPPPPPLSFSGSERFIKGRLPHRTAAISASLSALFSRDTGSHVDALDARKMGSALEENQPFQKPPSNDTAGNSSGDHLMGCNDCMHSLHSKSHVISEALDESAEVNFVADEQHHIVGPEVLTGNTGVNLELNNLDQPISAMPIVGEIFQQMEGPTNPAVVTQADDMEEGEISERLSDDDQVTCMREICDPLEVSAKVCSPDRSNPAADAQRGSSFDVSSPHKGFASSETDEGMDEPISSFASRCRMQLLLKRGNQKFSIQDNNRQHSKKRTYEDMENEEHQPVLDKLCSARLDSERISGRTMILQEGSSTVATDTAVKNDGVSSVQEGSIPASAPSFSDPVERMRLDGAQGTPDKQVVQQFDAGVSLSEKLNGSSSTFINEGLCLSTLVAGTDNKSASQGCGKKKKKKRVTEAARRKKQREKDKASDRKIAQSGTCKLKFRPYVEKKVEKPKKTCSFYVQGKCNKSADQCRFSHDAVPLTKSEICKYFVMNHCLKGEQCSYSHNLSSFPCRLFHTKRFCDAGKSCRFSHEPISEEAKQELIQRIEDEQRARQALRIGKVQDALKASTLENKYNSGMTPVHAANNDFSLARLHHMTQPSPDEHLKNRQAMNMEIGAGTKSPCSPVAKSLERRTRAEAFLQAQLNKSWVAPGSSLPAGLKKMERDLGSISKEPVVLPLGHAAPIRVSGMSVSCRPNVNASTLQNSSFLEIISKQPQADKQLQQAENGAQLSASSMTLLDMLLKPQGEALSKEPVCNLGAQSTDNSPPYIKSAPNTFLDRILR